MTIYFNFYGQPDQPPVPSLVAVRAVARNTVELEFDEAVIVREKTQLIQEPADRFTPVTWAGASTDAANPANYTFSRPASGSLTGDGEAVPLVATYAEEAEGYGQEQDYDSTTYVISTRVWVHTDYQHTARASYEVEVDGVRIEPTFPSIGDTPDSETTGEWTGYVVSQVARSTFIMLDQLPSLAVRLDDEGTGDLRKLFTCFQEIFDRVLEDVDAFFSDLCEIDRARAEFLDAILFDLGDPFSGIFNLTTNQKRKLIAVLVQMYREKGTCEGVVNVVRFFTGIQLLGCTKSLEGRWRLHGGSYPSTLVPPTGPYRLNDNAVLAPGTEEELRSFYVLYGTPGSLTADELSTIDTIVDYMKPAGSIYQGVRAP